VQETILADFKKHGIELQSATQGEDDLCGDDPTRAHVMAVAASLDTELGMLVPGIRVTTAPAGRRAALPHR